MTEQEWLTCTDPEPMVQFLRGKVSDRKLRLVAVAVSRLWGNELNDDGFGHQVVEVAERYADGLATEHERAKWHYAAYENYDQVRWDDGRNRTAFAHAFNCAIHHDCTFAARYVSSGWQGAGDKYPCRANTAHCVIFREIIGNPFCPLVVDPSWLTWNDGTVVALAQKIYAERDFDCLPILADSLEDAGCTSEGILNHCRQQEGHVRGCWVVDLLLGKQ